MYIQHQILVKMSTNSIGKTYVERNAALTLWRIWRRLHCESICSAVSVELQSTANPLRMRCELNSTNAEEKKISSFSRWESR